MCIHNYMVSQISFKINDNFRRVQFQSKLTFDEFINQSNHKVTIHLNSTKPDWVD